MHRNSFRPWIGDSPPGRTRRAGGRSSAPAWRGTSAGQQPLVATRIFTGGLPRWNRLERRFGRLEGHVRLASLLPPVAQLRQEGGVVLAADRPAPVPQVEARPAAHGVLLCGGERREGADVAPVRLLLVGLEAGDL